MKSTEESRVLKIQLGVAYKEALASRLAFPMVR
jgi:hypothetical protein